MVYQWINFARSKLFPTLCRLCCAPGEPGLELCSACTRELPWLSHTCHGCALPLPPEAQVTLCPDCQKRPLSLDHCSALFAYREPVAGWVQSLKFHQDLTVARLFGQLLAESLPPAENPPPLIVPVPLHRKRLAARGYNQALEIARPLRQRGYRLEPRCARRNAPTLAQSGLPASQRRANLRNAFSVGLQVHGQHVILIDDVLTTGATLGELAATLKRAGARRVEAMIIARTLREGTRSGKR